MKPQVLTMNTLAASPSAASSQPPAASRAASSSESTSLRAHPRVTRLTVRWARSGASEEGREGTPADYRCYRRLRPEPVRVRPSIARGNGAVAGAAWAAGNAGDAGERG